MIWAMVRHDGHVVSEATVLRLLRDEGLILPAAHQRALSRSRDYAMGILTRCSICQMAALLGWATREVR